MQDITKQSKTKVNSTQGVILCNQGPMLSTFMDVNL
jgi:hypothetical protein